MFHFQYSIFQYIVFMANVSLPFQRRPLSCELSPKQTLSKTSLFDLQMLRTAMQWQMARCHLEAKSGRARVVGWPYTTDCPLGFAQFWSTTLLVLLGSIIHPNTTLHTGTPCTNNVALLPARGFTTNWGLMEQTQSNEASCLQ